MTRFLARTALALTCAIGAPVAAHAQPAATSQPAAKAPSLAGTWELNVAASDFGPQGGPTKDVMTITQSGDKWTSTSQASSQMGDMTVVMHHTMGAATTDTIRPQGQALPFTSTTRWDGSAYVIEGKVSMQGMEIPVVSRYMLSPDGKQLTVQQVVTTPMGELPTRRVYDRKG